MPARYRYREPSSLHVRQSWPPDEPLEGWRLLDVQEAIDGPDPEWYWEGLDELGARTTATPDLGVRPPARCSGCGYIVSKCDCHARWAA